MQVKSCILFFFTQNKESMIKIIEWFQNASPFYFCLGLIGVAIVIRIIIEIITDKD